MIKNDYDKDIAKKLPKLGVKEMQESHNTILEYLNKERDEGGLPVNIMLMSKDLSYYTIFKKSPLQTAVGIATEIMKFLNKDEYLKTLGDLVDVDTNEQGSLVEIWIGSNHFGLFSCDFMFVELGGR